MRLWGLILLMMLSSPLIAKERDKKSQKKTEKYKAPKKRIPSFDEDDWDDWEDFDAWEETEPKKKQKSSKKYKPKSQKNIYDDELDEFKDDLQEIKSLMRQIPSLEALKDEIKKMSGGESLKLAKPGKDEKIKFHWELASEDGWKLGLDLGVNTDWDFNQLITGVDSGQYLKLGGKIAFIAGYMNGDHEWRNKIAIHESFVKTPTDVDWIKSTDLLAFESSYYWSPGRWWGVFGEIALDTSIFPGFDFEEDPANYHIVDAFGNPIRSVENVTELRLDDYFLPLHMNEFTGMFIRPFKIPEVTWELKLALFSHQTYADGQLKTIDRIDNDITIRELSTFYQVGANIGTDLYGVLDFLSITYRLSFDLGYAFFDTERVSVDSKFTNGLNMELESSVTLKPFSWVGITWDFRVVRLPNITTDFQIESNIYLNVPIEF